MRELGSDDRRLSAAQGWFEPTSELATSLPVPSVRASGVSFVAEAQCEISFSRAKGGIPPLELSSSRV